MKEIIQVTVRLVRAGQRIYAKKWSFLVFFVIAFLGSSATLAELDLLPEAKAPAAAVVAVTKTPTEPLVTAIAVSPELPTRIEIASINLSATIVNPETRNIDVLDQQLLRGAVRYPTSAKLGEDGNVVLFGHSSYLPVVKNSAYKTFNGIQKLVAGDTITVTSETTIYSYRVRTMEKKSANDAIIPLEVDGKVLTLSTCDSFGAKTDRFVVVADFVESHPVST